MKEAKAMAYVNMYGVLACLENLCEIDDEAKAIAEITETSDGRDSEEENTYYDRNKRNDNSSNSNSEIIALYKKGISILEISKMLSIGQGEVKLVVDLYNAR